MKGVKKRAELWKELQKGPNYEELQKGRIIKRVTKKNQLIETSGWSLLDDST